MPQRRILCLIKQHVMKK